MAQHFPLSVSVWNTLISVLFFSQVTGFTYGDCIYHGQEHHGNQEVFLCFRKNLIQVPKRLPLTATYIDISHNNIHTIKTTDFQNLSHLYTLNISNNAISHVQNGAFRDLSSLTELGLGSNRLIVLTNVLFQGLTNLKVLMLERNKISSIENSTFLPCHQLQTVKMYKNELEDVRRMQALFEIPTLTELDIGLNNISVFQSIDILNSSSLKLRVLNLSHNPLYEFRISTDIFPYLEVIDLSFSFSTQLFHWEVLSKVFFQRLKTLSLVGVNISVEQCKIILETFNRSLCQVTLNSVYVAKSLLRYFCQISTLTDLNVRKSNLTSLNGTGIENCSHVQNLDLGYNFLSHLVKEFDSLKNLTFLDLSNNKFSNIPPILLQLSKLKTLSFKSNKIKDLDCFSFKNIKNLQFLYLNGNGITKVEACVFQNLTCLKTLNLGSNHINSLEGAFTDGPFNLEILDLSFNNLMSISTNDLSGLRSIHTLFLKGNKIKNIQTKAFLSLGSLRRLELQSNKITDETLQPAMFLGLTNLLELHIQENHILRNKQAIAPFCHLKNLKLLAVFSQPHRDIDTFIHSTFLLNLTTLQTFLAQDVGLKSLPSDLFKDNPQLTVLNLGGNNLTSLSSKLFVPIPNLLKLDLKDTRLKSLDFLVQANLQMLYYLQVSKNLITTLNATIINSVPRLKMLRMEENMFSCDCSNAWLVRWIETCNDTQVLSANRFECNSPPNRKSTKLLDVDMHACSVDIEFYCYIFSALLVLLFSIIPLMYHLLHWQIVYAYYLFLAFLYDKKRGAGKSKCSMYDAFISYNVHDELWVTNELVPKLEGEQGWRLCLHHRDFQPGKPIVDNIVDGIYGSRKTICIISRHYLESEWCSREVQVASFRLFDEKKDVLILVFLEDIPVYQLSPYHRLRGLVKKHTFLSWPKIGQDTNIFWEKLRLALRDRKEIEEEAAICNVQNIF